MKLEMDDLDNLTDFERELAECVPLLRSDVKDDILRALGLPVILLKLCVFQNVFYKRAEFFRIKVQILLKQYFAVGLCCFLLGATAMYGVMNYVADYRQQNSYNNAADISNNETTEYEIITPHITNEFIDSINSPINLTKKITQQNVKRIVQQKPNIKITQYQNQIINELKL
ncbi:MAG: hypothetical protein LBP59_18585 [Planctomycetaceae bacterium]|jgi:hypothetical protein|nr:hypothetical protein [Planctomycetaceae bacterium]